MNAKPLVTLTLIVLLAGCGGASQADQVATEVAAGIAATQAIERQVATIVAATAAAAAPTLQASPSAESAPTLTAAPSEAATATPSPSEAPAEAPTNTPAELVPLPTDTPLPTPTPPPVAAVFPIGGSTQGVDGSVLVPGYSQAPVPPEAFGDTLAFRVMVRDPAVGQADGDGIERVEFRVQQVDPDGNQFDVYERVEMSAPYCMFSGDDPACNPIDLVQGATFPNGTPLVTGQYHVEIAIFGLDPEKNAFWNFDFLVELQ
jgi:hypothetical protein